MIGPVILLKIMYVQVLFGYYVFLNNLILASSGQFNDFSGCDLLPKSRYFFVTKIETFLKVH